MARYNSITETVGRTPVVRINRLAPEGVNLWVKVEAFNPLGSVKDRLALGVIEAAERSGELKPGMQVLLCSDGLTEEVEDTNISQVLSHSECSAQECVDGLVAAALDGGGSDNITVVLVRRS